ncbi:glycine zipper 2TM domain-containing protein [Methylophaga sp.]|uniref:glycine zipper 2TM domain-containing protein n=1 Tax=Methylophaga sp. TaxID=2024840 RepID=UPI0014001E8C|nr:glycine zipper 2TM domain-containing protein [Methylophaga sp.]MTI63817.1 glycine zipper 2TM domain-containing protein [Methylophaga sp.]
MKKIIKTMVLASAFTLTSANVMADHNDRYGYDGEYRDYGRSEKARVTHVEPIYRTVTVNRPERECWDEPRRHRSGHQSYTNTIAGGIIGGVIGNQFGGGSGNTAMTIAGTLLGGSVGRDMGNRYHDVDYGYQEQCRVIDRQYREQRIDGYEVSYRYQGRIYTTVMDQPPGKFIPVDVHVEPRRSYY